MSNKKQVNSCIKSLLLLITLISLTILMCACVESGKDSKTVYTNLINKVISEYENSDETVSEYIPKLVGTFTDEKTGSSSTKMNYEFALDTSTKEFYLKNEDNKLLVDVENEEMYFDDGDEAVKAKFTDEMKESIQKSLNEFGITEGDSKKMIVRIMADVRDNLKDEYFSFESKSGVKYYKMDLTNEQFKEFCNNLMDTLAKDDEFLEAYVNLYNSSYTYSTMTKESFAESIADAKESLAENIEENGIKLSTIIYSKDKDLKQLVGFRMSLKGIEDEEEVEYLFEVNANDAELSQAKQLNFKLEAPQETMNFELKAQDNKTFMFSEDLKLTGTVKMFSSSNERYLSTLEEKAGTKSTIKADNVPTTEVTVEGILNKKTISFDVKEVEKDYSTLDENGKKVDLFDAYYEVKYGDYSWYYSFDEEEDEEDDDDTVEKAKNYIKNLKFEESDSSEFKFEAKTTDGKEFIKSKEVTITMTQDGEEEMACIIRTEDDKEIQKSSDIAVFIKNGSEETKAIVIKAADGKAFEATSKVIISINTGDEEKLIDILTIEAMDNKTLVQTKDLKFAVDVDEDNFFELEIKDNTQALADANFEKDDIEFSAKFEEKTYSSEIKCNMEFKDKKLDFEFTSKVEGYTSTYYTRAGSEEKITLHIEILDNLDMNKYFSKSKAKEVEMDELEKKLSSMTNVSGLLTSSSSSNTTNRSQLAAFESNFAEFSSAVQLQSLNLQSTLGAQQINVTSAQLYYMTANGLQNMDNSKLMKGYELPEVVKKLYDSNDNVVAFVIDDTKISGYDEKAKTSDGSASYEFYGDSNGDEYHFITSEGNVFTLPGYEYKNSDGTITMYISNRSGGRYTITGSSNLKVGDTNINGDKIDCEEKIQFSSLTAKDVDLTKQRVCPKCGAKYDVDANFCGLCGTTLVD